jgi:hypothetical protein
METLALKENMVYAIGGIDIEIFKDVEKLKTSLGTKCPGKKTRIIIAKL